VCPDLTFLACFLASCSVTACWAFTHLIHYFYSVLPYLHTLIPGPIKPKLLLPLPGTTVVAKEESAAREGRAHRLSEWTKILPSGVLLGLISEDGGDRC
jgi:hypothetical protein